MYARSGTYPKVRGLGAADPPAGALLQYLPTVGPLSPAIAAAVCAQYPGTAGCKENITTANWLADTFGQWWWGTPQAVDVVTAPPIVKAPQTAEELVSWTPEDAALSAPDWDTWVDSIRQNIVRSGYKDPAPPAPETSMFLPLVALGLGGGLLFYLWKGKK